LLCLERKSAFFPKTGLGNSSFFAEATIAFCEGIITLKTLPTIIVPINAPTCIYAALALNTCKKNQAKPAINKNKTNQKRTGFLDKGEKAVWILPVAIVGMISLTFVTAPRTKSVCKDDVPATFSEIQPILIKRCVQCHSANPTDDVLKLAPNGIKFDTPEECAAMAERILNRAAPIATLMPCPKEPLAIRTPGK